MSYTDYGMTTTMLQMCGACARRMRGGMARRSGALTMPDLTSTKGKRKGGQNEKQKGGSSLHDLCITLSVS
jgi:hypothetical protein